MKNALAAWVCAACLFCAAAPVQAQSSVFDFESVALGTATSFTDINNGLAATFSTPSDPGGFAVGSSFFQTLTGNILASPGPAGQSHVPLDITFDQPLSSFSLNYATDDFQSAASPITMSLYSGGLSGTLIGSMTETGVVPAGGFYPEGVFSFSGGQAFDAVSLSAAPTHYFAVDNLKCRGAVPEASPLALLGLGLPALGLLARRARRP